MDSLKGRILKGKGVREKGKGNGQGKERRKAEAARCAEESDHDGESLMSSEVPTAQQAYSDLRATGEKSRR